METKLEATFDGSTWYDVTDVKTEEVKTRTRGVLVFTRYYFGKAHAPAYSYEIKEVREKRE